jgi:hypothetical protein
MTTTFKDRLQLEKTELNEKISKLNLFLTGEKFSSLSDIHKDLLTRQLSAMQIYCQILEDRLYLLKDEN